MHWGTLTFICAFLWLWFSTPYYPTSSLSTLDSPSVTSHLCAFPFICSLHVILIKHYLHCSQLLQKPGMQSWYLHPLLSVTGIFGVCFVLSGALCLFNLSFSFAFALSMQSLRYQVDTFPPTCLHENVTWLFCKFSHCYKLKEIALKLKFPNTKPLKP